MNIKFGKIVNVLAQANIIRDRYLSLFWISEVSKAEVDLEDLYEAIIHLKDAVDVMKPLEMSVSKIEVRDLTTVFLFLESAKDALFRAKIPHAVKAMDKVIKNINKACKTQSERHQKRLISEILNALNKVLDSIEKAISNVVVPIITHMTYEELLCKLAAYSSNVAF
ncbi:hypothetical protein [Rivularia sp. UHCC 0363]|uniref:hypothetical protein n=1 Tax=Rivularia sp. UHCC 0363 TaxID=3110244 RepID=UPI002B205115|nr:hypothetical protein [Rivularia sp. UHCC 0363]MEA5593500.1 hypothetical protein [Rivularia sp. UHCC 0363]